MAGPERVATLLRVTEIFCSIQGESTAAGLPCAFVRLTGCPLRCVWCDTGYAFSGGEDRTVAEIVAEIGRIGLPLVEVTGGEPLAQPGCHDLLRTLCDQGFRVLLETSGALPVSGVDPRVRIVMDWKCPGSGESGRNLEENLIHLKDDDEVKLVLASREDYDWARAQMRAGRFGGRQVPFAAVWGALDPGDLARWVLADRLTVRLQVQLHKILFGEETKGA